MNPIACSYDIRNSLLFPGKPIISTKWGLHKSLEVDSVVGKMWAIVVFDVLIRNVMSCHVRQDIDSTPGMDVSLKTIDYSEGLLA